MYWCEIDTQMNNLIIYNDMLWMCVGLLKDRYSGSNWGWSLKKKSYNYYTSLRDPKFDNPILSKPNLF